MSATEGLLHHGLNVAPDASPDGVRAETRRREHDGGGEPSNAPNAAPTLLDAVAAMLGAGLTQKEVAEVLARTPAEDEYEVIREVLGRHLDHEHERAEERIGRDIDDPYGA